MNNTSCILTVIKNEHEYLDEWIKYHIDLGIDHIFIFEDIDSESHKEICDKYGDKITLDTVDIVLDEQNRKKVRELKDTKKSNPQYIYIQKGLSYIKRTQANKFDWCFVIDNDEFITLEKPNDNLSDVVSLFDGYDAFIMQWKCYGANGLIKKPDYTNKGVIETYIKEIEGYVPTATPQSLSKTCYNLKTYQETYFLYTHQPSKECNFCRTNFERDRNTPIYDKIYIRHYITKSWEEYVWKKTKRGFLFGKIRDYDFFFKVNPDLNYKKYELMKLINTSKVTPFYLYITNNGLSYSAHQVLENEDKIFLIESNKLVHINNIVSINEYCFDIKDNDFYVMIVIDKKSNGITLCYGIFSYCHSLYYYISNDNLYINISLHDLLKYIKISPKLDIRSANEFVDNGFVRGESTLIEQIKKVPPLKTVIINKKNDIRTFDSIYYNREGLNNYIDNLKLNLPQKEIKTILPLSGGFDSTLLSYLIRDNKEKIALSVGSLDDTKSTELPNAKKTTAYLRMPHQEIYSDNKWIESFPKIVDVMEGEMFDPGVFLCYFLIDKIKELNFTDYTLLTGDGADQLLNKNFYEENINEKPLYNRINNIFVDKYPKHFFYYVIIKKIEWLLRLEGVSYVTPFMSKEFSDFAKKTTFTEHKQEYKKFVKSYLPIEISNTLVKRGGLVAERYLINEEIRKDFLDILHMPKYRNLFNTNCNPNELRKLLYKMYVVFFHYIFIEGNSINMNFRTILNEIKSPKI